MKAVPNPCGAKMLIGDDQGDNTASITCQLRDGHRGRHQERFHRNSCGWVTIRWQRDEGPDEMLAEVQWKLFSLIRDAREDWGPDERDAQTCWRGARRRRDGRWTANIRIGYTDVHGLRQQLQGLPDDVHFPTKRAACQALLDAVTARYDAQECSP